MAEVADTGPGAEIPGLYEVLVTVLVGLYSEWRSERTKRKEGIAFTWPLLFYMSEG